MKFPQIISSKNNHKQTNVITRDRRSNNMETCKAITIRFEETLIVQEHSTLKHGAFLGLKKRGNCTQLLEKTLREGKGPNHFFFFLFPFSSSPIFQNFPSILSIKNHFQPTKWFSFSSANRYIIARHHFLSFTPPRRVFTTSRQFFSLSKRILRFPFSFLTPCQTPSVCFPSTDRTPPSSLPPRATALSLSFSLCLLHRESTPRVYLSHNRNESRYLYIRRHMGPYGRKESGDGRGGRVHDPFEDTNLRHVKQIVGREMEEEWTYELSTTILSPSIFFPFLFRDDSRLNFDTGATFAPPLLYPAITTVPLSRVKSPLWS